MEKYIGILRHTKLFAGVGESDVASMLHCLQTRMRRCGKGEYVFRQGEHLDCIAVLVEGGLHVQRDDYWGNRTILAQFSSDGHKKQRFNVLAALANPPRK